MFEAGIHFSAWSCEDGVLNLHTRELSAEWINEVRSEISRDMRAARMSTMDTPLHSVRHILQQAQQRTATQGTDESIEVIKSADECLTISVAKCK